MQPMLGGEEEDAHLQAAGCWLVTLTRGSDSSRACPLFHNYHPSLGSFLHWLNDAGRGQSCSPPPALSAPTAMQKFILLLIS